MPHGPLRPVWADRPAGLGEPGSRSRFVQPGLDELGTPLREVTFVVVDLETTGTDPSGDAITEIGAVKVRGGEVLAELGTLVDPGRHIPATVQVLTGITTTMVVGAPKIDQVLPTFLEFSRDCVLVAHNAPFDIGFLKAAASSCGYPWPGNKVVDTVRLARRVILRDEVPNHRLSTLAQFFRTATAPNHRALDDARATVDVLHGLFERLAPLGVTYLEDLAAAADPVPDQVRRRRHLADDLPDLPGVYLFRGPKDEVLYVGTSTTSLRKRVRSYFTAAEKRSRMAEMVRLATRVDPIVCVTGLEARVRELRLIAELSPRYNRRSRFPDRMPWIRLTKEPYPRLSVVRDVVPDTVHIGPFSSADQAQLAVDALHSAFPIRTCTRRLPATPSADALCVLGEIGRCPAPCANADPDGSYADLVDRLRLAMTTDPMPVVAAQAERIADRIETERFEDAARIRDQLGAFLRGSARVHLTGALGEIPELAAAQRHDHGWEIVLIRFGRLAGTAWSGPGQNPREVLESVRQSAEHVPAPIPPKTACHPEEAEILIGWLNQPDIRLVGLNGTWATPITSAAKTPDPTRAIAELSKTRSRISRTSPPLTFDAISGMIAP